MRLAGKVAVITGAGKGIGEATALLFGKEGASVCCNSLTDSAKSVAERITSSGGAAIFVKADVSREEEARRLIEQTVKVFGRIDILFNNAGIVIPGRVDNISVAEWDQTMSVNVRSTYLVSRFSLPHLRKTKGTIINNASSVAWKGVKDRAAYSASKGAILALTRAMAIDYIHDRVRVNCVCPGTTDTPSLAARINMFKNPPTAREEFISRQPLGRFGRPDEIAEGVLFLCLAEFCSGTSLSIDGGMTI
jgi:meso-butanediol dehydrogenase/(S,S)-butanediol dehydrogenase/diacetyl reductase